MSHETRSDEPAGAQLPLFPGLAAPPAAAPAPPMNRGVGARQGPARPPKGGGGYLDECNAPELPDDPRFRELAEIGLAPVWLMTAQRLGYETFLELWRHLSADDRALTDDGQILLSLRPFSAYERLQRDLYIRRLSSLGLPPSEIHGMVHRHLGDTSTMASIKRVTKASWACTPWRAAQLVAGLSPYLIERMRETARANPDLFPVALEHALMAEACKAPPQPAEPDGRIAELAEIGLADLWTDVARLVGYQAFLDLWRRWSSIRSLRDTHSHIELRLRPVRAFQRYQRNRYIETLVAAGLRPSEIYQMLRQQLGEEMSFRHLKRLVAAGRVRA